METHIIDEERKTVEKETIRTDLRRCGYPNWVLQERQMTDMKVKTSVQRDQQGEQTRSKTNILIQYEQGMTEQLQRVFRKNHDIAEHLKSGYTLREALVAPKDTLSSDEKEVVIYSVT